MLASRCGEKQNVRTLKKKRRRRGRRVGLPDGRRRRGRIDDPRGAVVH